eukprot:1156503-Pelagomonas_calceolata.AAC.2
MQMVPLLDCGLKCVSPWGGASSPRSQFQIHRTALVLLLHQSKGIGCTCKGGFMKLLSGCRSCSRGILHSYQLVERIRSALA